MLKIAKITLPLAIDKDFDYQVPASQTLKPGMRVLVNFNRKEKIGIVKSLSNKTKIASLKPVNKVIDSCPLLTDTHFEFAKNLANYYPYPSSKFLFMMLPPQLRKKSKQKINLPLKNNEAAPEKEKLEFIKLDLFLNRYSIWKKEVKKALTKGSVVICLPQLTFLKKIGKLLKEDFSQKIFEFFSKQPEKDLLDNWINSRQKSLILGTRSCLFYFPKDTRLIIIEEETSPYYFQEVQPFYHLRKAALILTKQLKNKLILSGSYPSLYTYNMINKGKIKLTEPDKTGKDLKKIEVINRDNFAKYKYINPVFLELIRKTISEKKKGVIIWNKKHFWRIISCSNCGNTLNCRRCSSFLQQEEKNKNELICPQCQKKIPYPEICPECKKGYLKGKTMGIEKLKEILTKFFPEVKLENIENYSNKSLLVLSTSKILNYLYQKQSFDRGFVLDTDSYLDQFDFDATFKTFIYLKNLSLLLKEKLFIFSSRPNYYLFEYINKEWTKFYDNELQLRKQMSLPPFVKIIRIILRHNDQRKTLKNGEKLYNILKKKKYDIFGPFKESPHKLRGKYRYSLIVKLENKNTSDKPVYSELNKIKRKGIQSAVILN
ncbi:MAG: hypothetical protein K9L95_01390 [Candidatus Omnitrophica bacterium]|nr:hypothetical protein [Candidatus Omnitrophota bacterium]MCF7876813.1 hypothetical protein [Candidatus Omnitrophota bacterium]MCF7878108.1 hypothetical protein [Candidatus Omnitrophota bacterium]MCF7892988.1 hypothetical protein [Candidatus Omnitrophota bacterium]